MISQLLLCFTVYSVISHCAGYQGIVLPADYSVDHRGNAFCVAFLQNGPNSTLELHILTDEPDEVKVNITFFGLSPITVNVLDNTSTVVSIPSSLTVAPSTVTRNAISIRTTNPRQNVTVFCKNSQNSTGSSDVFLALPVREYGNSLQYHFAHFSPQRVPGQNESSIFILSNCGETEVDSYLQSPTHLANEVLVPDIYRVFIDSREFIEVIPTPLRMKRSFEAFAFESLDLDIAGIKAWSNLPFSFTSGRACTTEEECDHFSLQIPPTYTWGYSFTSFPVSAITNVTGYSVIALAAYNDTSVTFHCTNGTNGSDTLTDEIYTLDFLPESVCSFVSVRPIGVVQILHVNSDVSSAMVWLPAFTQYLNSITFVSNLLSSTLNDEEFAWVSVPADFFNASQIKLDGVILQNDQESWIEIICSPFQVCAYGTIVQLSQGKHTINHESSEGCLSVTVFGSHENSINGYTTGFKMDPIGVPIVSFTHHLYNGSEAILPNITLTRTGDIFVALDVIIHISNAPDVTRDFISNNETVHFEVGERYASMILRVRDDLRVETLESFSLTLMQQDPLQSVVLLPMNEAMLQIQDNDMLRIGFTVDSIDVTEESEIVVVILRSNLPLQDSGMNIRVFTEELSASDSIDYTRLSNTMFLRPGESEWTITDLIVNDRRVEGTESFIIGFSVINSAVNATVTINRVQVNILDTDTINIRFMESFDSVKENGIAQIAVIKDGVTDLPHSFTVSTENNTAFSGRDYIGLNNVPIDFAVNDTRMYINVSILPDLILESDETFILTLSSIPNERISFDSGSRSVVSITDDDDVEIGFSADEFPVNENDNVAMVTVEIKQGMAAERPFAFHVETFEQQAREETDYISLNTDLLFPSFQTSFIFNVTLVDNNIAEDSSEGFTIALTNSFSVDSLVVNISSEFSRTTVAIKEDDNVLIRMDTEVLVGREGGPDLRLRLVKTGSIVAIVPVSVFLFVIEDTATQNADFTIDEIVEFQPQENEQFATIKLLPDAEKESTESFEVLLVHFDGPVDVDLNQVLTVSILDADVTTIDFSASTYSVVEGDTVPLMLTVTGFLNNSMTIVISVSLGTADVADFEPFSSQVLELPAGVPEHMISLQTVDDDVLENTENLTVSLSISGNSTATIGQQSTALVSITDNDEVAVTLMRELIEVSENVSDIVLSIQKSGASEVDIGLRLLFEDKSATRIIDYLYEGSPVVNLLAEESSANITIHVVNDKTVEEKQEDFVVSLVATQMRINIGNINSTRIIINDDDVLEVLFNQSTYTVSEDSNSLLVSIISRGSTEMPLSVVAMTKDGNAIANEDYDSLSQHFLFNETMLEYSFIIRIHQDLILEGTQEFLIDLQTNSTLIFIPMDGRQATIMITDGAVSDVIISLSMWRENVFENDGKVFFNVSITGQRQKSVFVRFKTRPGSAIASEDYIPTQTMVVLDQTDSHTTITVQLVNDELSEVKESFFGVISCEEPAVTIANNQSEVFIRDDEGAVVFLERALYVVNEGESLVINVSRSVDLSAEIELVIIITDSFTAASTQMMTIPAGSTSIPVLSLNPPNDRVFESINKTTNISISLPSTQLGAIITSDTASIVVMDQDMLVFTGINTVTSELNSTTDVCFLSNIPSTVPVEIHLNYSSSLNATVTLDNSISTVVINVPSSPQQPSVFCTTLSIFLNDELESDEHVCLTASSTNSRVTFEYNSTTFCPSQSVTVTIKDAGVRTLPVCQLMDAMVVAPFPRPLASSLPYSYRGNCEHVLIQQCNNLRPLFTINIDHDPNDLTISRIAIRINTSFVFIDVADFTYTTENFQNEQLFENDGKLYDGIVTVTSQTDINDSFIQVNLINLGIIVELMNEISNSSNIVTINATSYDRNINGELCGLCGNLDGILVYSDQVNRVLSRTAQVYQDFARSWLVNPEDQITRDSSRECGILTNDSVVGDPLYSVPVYPSNSSLQSASLCFEVHGAVGKIFNLVSDRCVSVNALYFSMNNPNDGNVITSVGVKAVDNDGKCIDVVVSLSQQCIPLVNSVQTNFYSQSGISVRKNGGKVIVSVPNCENEHLVMWMMCRTIDQQRMLDFTIRRGLNLRPTSHGLLGQFWNVPVHLSSYHTATELPENIREDYDSNQLYLVTIRDPISFNKKREFIGELSKRSWDKSRRSCLYVGSSQGGRLMDIPGPRDSVIEGIYTHYVVTDGLLGTTFKYSKFDQNIC